MDDNNKNNPGPVSVDDDITPITHKPIQRNDASQWQSMTVSELWEQRIALDNKLNYALQIGHAEMIRQLQRGLTALDQLIESRAQVSDDKPRLR